MAILLTGFGKSMIFTFFAMAKEETPSSKTCMISISPLKSSKDDQISYTRRLWSMNRTL